MSGMDERARQFRTDAESQLKGDALVKEINTLRRFLFRNQEYRFTKSAQAHLYTAILAHHTNPDAFDSSKQEAPIVRLLDDALKMPFTVFSSAQKDKLLALYWSVLGEDSASKGRETTASTAPKVRVLTLMDIEHGNPCTLALMHDDGTDYDRIVHAPPHDLGNIQAAYASGREVLVTVQECDDGATATVTDVEIVDENN